LKNCHFGEITKAWTTEYLKENLISPNLTVYKSTTRRFLFYNRENAEEMIANMSWSDWSPPHNVTKMGFVQFLREMDELDSAGNGTRIYLQVKFGRPLSGCKCSNVYVVPTQAIAFHFIFIYSFIALL
jgi:hypothetical protein